MYHRPLYMIVGYETVEEWNLDEHNLDIPIGNSKNSYNGHCRSEGTAVIINLGGK